LDGLTAQAADGYQAGLPTLRSALRALANEPERALSTDALSVLWLGCRVAIDLWDDEALVQIGGRLATAARDAGALTELPGALGMAPPPRPSAPGTSWRRGRSPASLIPWPPPLGCPPTRTRGRRSQRGAGSKFAPLH
jgi:hypothetical protein